jgi:hypothetical protein
MDLSHHYSIHPHDLHRLNARELSIMLSAMLANRAQERLRRIEEICFPYMDKAKSDKFIDSIMKQIDDKYKDPHMVSEDELKRIFQNG